MTVAAIGMFDGVHLGHQEIIKVTNQIANLTGTNALVITFDPDPENFFAKEQFTAIMSTDDRIKSMKSYGAQKVIAIPFDLNISQLTPETFLAHIASEFHISNIVTGNDFRFGHKKSGNNSNIYQFCKKNHIRYTNINRITLDSKEISSSRIKILIASGMVKAISRLLGRNYSIRGSVIAESRYDGLLAESKVRTAKISLPDNNIIYPYNGVYTINVQLQDKRRYFGILSISTQPLIRKLQLYEDILLAKQSNLDRILEIHLFNVDENLYRQELDIDFLEFIRPEYAFDNADMMNDQIYQDIKAAQILIINTK